MFRLTLLASSDGQYLAASLSTHVIKVYQRGEGGSISALLELTGHGGPVTDVTFPLPEEPHLVTSSSEDGTVRLWDCRAASAGGREAQRYTAHFAKSFATAALGGGGDHLVCGGCKEQIVFWDRRAGGGLEVFEDSHSEDVTRLRFQPGRRHRLFTASVDGLACAFDCGGNPSDLSDEDGLLAVMTAGAAIVEMGFCARPGLGGGRGAGGPSGGGGGGGEADVLWVLTGNEELWMFDAAGNLETLGDLLAHVPETREAAARAAAVAGIPTRAVPGGAREEDGGDDDDMVCGLSHRVDYLVTCFSDCAAGTVLVAAGTQDGTVGVFPVVPGSDPAEPTAASLGAPVVRFSACAPHTRAPRRRRTRLNSPEPACTRLSPSEPATPALTPAPDRLTRGVVRCAVATPGTVGATQTPGQSL